MQIIVEKRNVWGNDLYYPICNKAKSFAKLLDTKTLTKQKLKEIKHSLGYEIEVEQETF
tara:strand:- start:824 stop:1000 length:177 start_codon:yes stop_codon:yes gene_type:complete